MGEIHATGFHSCKEPDDLVVSGSNDLPSARSESFFQPTIGLPYGRYDIRPWQTACSQVVFNRCLKGWPPRGWAIDFSPSVVLRLAYVVTYSQAQVVHMQCDFAEPEVRSCLVLQA